MSNPVWLEVKRAYLNGEGPLRVLAERFNVSQDTLEKRCSREGWRKEMAALCGTAADSAVAAAMERGRELGLNAAKFVARSARESEQWLDRIQDVAAKGVLNSDKIGKLVPAWSKVIETGRTAHGLSDGESPTSVRISILSMASIRPLPAVDSPPTIDVESSPTTPTDPAA